MDQISRCFKSFLYLVEKYIPVPNYIDAFTWKDLLELVGIYIQIEVIYFHDIENFTFELFCTFFRKAKKFKGEIRFSFMSLNSMEETGFDEKRRSLELNFEKINTIKNK